MIQSKQMSKWCDQTVDNICFTIFATPAAFKQLKCHFQYRHLYNFNKFWGIFRLNLSKIKMIQMDSLRMNISSKRKVESHSYNDQNFYFKWILPLDPLYVYSVFPAPQGPSDEHRTHLCQVKVWDDILSIYG